jgi:hypothetical protein
VTHLSKEGTMQEFFYKGAGKAYEDHECRQD